MIIDDDLGFLNAVQVLTKNKVDTIGRYYCSKDDVDGAYKVISAQEALQLAQANIRLFTIHEASVVDLTKGVAHASTAMQQAGDIGQPPGSAIYFGIEKDGGFTKADMPQVIQYFNDINATIAGKFDIGVYSNGTTCATLLGPPKLVKYTWLAFASYAHDGTWDFYVSGLWTIAQMGPTDIKTSLIPSSWQVAPGTDPQWKIDIDLVQGPFGSFMANPPAAALAAR
jgi:hypothetical protein